MDYKATLNLFDLYNCCIKKTVLERKRKCFRMYFKTCIILIGFQLEYTKSGFVINHNKAKFINLRFLKSTESVILYERNVCSGSVIIIMFLKNKNNSRTP